VAVISVFTSDLLTSRDFVISLGKTPGFARGLQKFDGYRIESKKYYGVLLEDYLRPAVIESLHPEIHSNPS